MLLNNYCNADLCGLVAFARCAALRVGCICALRAGYRCNRWRCHAFDGGIFFEGGFLGINSTLIDAHTLPGQTEGLRVGRGMGGWVGLQKLITDLDMRNGHKGGVRVGFININDMYNNDVGKGVVYAYEAYEAK